MSRDYRVTHRAARLPLDKSAGGGAVDNPTSQGFTYRQQNPLQRNGSSSQHGLSEKSFYRWRGKEKEALAAGHSSLTLVPVSVSPLTSGGIVRLHSPGGWRIELPSGDAGWLADLLRQLP